MFVMDPRKAAYALSRRQRPIDEIERVAAVARVVNALDARSGIIINAQDSRCFQPGYVL